MKYLRYGNRRYLWGASTNARTAGGKQDALPRRDAAGAMRWWNFVATVVDEEGVELHLRSDSEALKRSRLEAMYQLGSRCVHVGEHAEGF